MPVENKICDVYSLKCTPPTLTTKKKVAIMRLIIVVKLRTMTTWVSVIRVHQGVTSITSGCIVGDRPAGSPKGFLAGVAGLAKGLATEEEEVDDGPRGLTGVLSAAKREPLLAGVASMEGSLSEAVPKALSAAEVLAGSSR